MTTTRNLTRAADFPTYVVAAGRPYGLVRHSLVPRSTQPHQDPA